MKVAIVCPRTPRIYFAGIENSVANISKYLKNKGIDITVYTSANTPDSKAKLDDIKIKEFKGFSPGEAFYFSPELYSALKNSKADIIHCNGFNNLTTLIGKHKGFHNLIKAFSVIVKKNKKAELLIIGSASYKKKLIKLVKDLKLKSKVNFLPFIPFEKRKKLIQLLKESGVFVFLSEYELQGIVVYESIVAGIPVIVANKAALKEVVEQVMLLVLIILKINKK